VGVASSGAPEKIARNLASSGLAPLLPPSCLVSATMVRAALRRLRTYEPRTTPGV
jgi:hypothetical protein